MSKIRCSQRTISILQTNPSKDVQKNILKSYNFTKNKPHHKCFDNNLQKLFRTIIVLENATFDTCLDDRLMLRQLADLISNGES